MKKAIGTLLLGVFTALIVLGAVAIWNGCRIAEDGINLMWVLAGTIATLLGLVGGVFTLKPRIGFSPVCASFAALPLEVLFSVRNGGLFAIRDVKCEVVKFHNEATRSVNDPRPMLLSITDPEQRLDRSENSRTFPVIQPGHAGTVDMKKMSPLLHQQPDSASIVVAISCRQIFWPLRGKEKFQYELFKRAGQYHWSEEPAQ